MKQKDILYLVAAVVFGVVMSLVIAKFTFSNSSNLSQQVDVVPSISTDFQAPNSAYFNNQSIDPTQIINIGPSSNNQPFNKPSQ